jgi:hypothetical protein
MILKINPEITLIQSKLLSKATDPTRVKNQFKLYIYDRCIEAKLTLYSSEIKVRKQRTESQELNPACIKP